MLYVPAWHTALIPYFRFLYPLHIAMGFLFLGLLVLPYAAGRWPKRRFYWPDWSWSGSLGIGLVATGVGIIWLVPAGWRPAALTAHGLLSALYVVWLLYHARIHGVWFGRAVHLSRVDTSRRSFLRWAGKALAATAAVWVGLGLWDQLARLAASAKGPGGSPGGALPGFVPYTVIEGYPNIPTASWSLAVDGACSTPRRYSWARFLAQPQSRETFTFHCVTGWTVPGSKWEGVPLREVVRAAGPTKEARYVLLYSADGSYTESLPLSMVLGDGSILLAHTLDGAPLPRQQGAPVRLIVPKMYGYKSIKWVNRISLSPKDQRGYWEVRGYAEQAWIGSRGWLGLGDGPHPAPARRT